MKERNINLDLIRCVAAIFVISVHFCLNSGFYELTCSGMRMLIMCILRTAFITCVPLFFDVDRLPYEQKRIDYIVL